MEFLIEALKPYGVDANVPQPAGGDPRKKWFKGTSEFKLHGGVSPLQD
jgi:hypothetical protein